MRAYPGRAETRKDEAICTPVAGRFPRENEQRAEGEQDRIRADRAG